MMFLFSPPRHLFKDIRVSGNLKYGLLEDINFFVFNLTQWRRRMMSTILQGNQMHFSNNIRVLQARMQLPDHVCPPISSCI